MSADLIRQVAERYDDSPPFIFISAVWLAKAHKIDNNRRNKKDDTGKSAANVVPVERLVWWHLQS